MIHRLTILMFATMLTFTVAGPTVAQESESTPTAAVQVNIRVASYAEVMLKDTHDNVEDSGKTVTYSFPLLVRTNIDITLKHEQADANNDLDGTTAFGYSEEDGTPLGENPTIGAGAWDRIVNFDVTISTSNTRRYWFSGVEGETDVEIEQSGPGQSPTRKVITITITGDAN